MTPATWYVLNKQQLLLLILKHQYYLEALIDAQKELPFCQDFLKKQTKSFSHFEFILGNGVRVCSSFIDLHATVQVSQPIKLLEENIGKSFSDINLTNVFLGQTPKATEIKAKINQWYLIKLTNFCKGNHKKIKDNLWNGRKQFQKMELRGLNL